MKTAAFLIMEQGTPYAHGTILPLQFNKNLIGRMTVAGAPDISFTNLLISRNHCIIEYRDEEWILFDLDSRHGTMVNNRKVAQSEEVPLSNGDQVQLANEIVSFRFVLQPISENTMDPASTQPEYQPSGAGVSENSFCVDMDKLQILIDEQAVQLSAKEWELFALLYRNRNKVMTYETIMNEVWKERILDHHALDVSHEEVNILIFRLRKKLGQHSSLLKTIRGRGFIFDG